MHEIEIVLDATDPHGCGVCITRLRVESGWIYYRRLRDGSVDSTTAAFVPDLAVPFAERRTRAINCADYAIGEALRLVLENDREAENVLNIARPYIVRALTDIQETTRAKV